MTTGSFSHTVLGQFLEVTGIKKIFDEYDEPDKEEYVTGRMEMCKDILMKADGDLEEALRAYQELSDRANPPPDQSPNP